MSNERMEPIKTIQAGSWKIRFYKNRLEATSGTVSDLRKQKTIFYSNIADIETGQFFNTTTILTDSGAKIKFPSRRVKNEIMELSQEVKNEIM
jgi:ABC-type Fe3+-hydroxamate transport system substrate-binding protein